MVKDKEAWENAYSRIVEAGDKTFCRVKAAALYDSDFLLVYDSGKPSFNLEDFGTKLFSVMRVAYDSLSGQLPDTVILTYPQSCFYAWPLKLKDLDFTLVVETYRNLEGMGAFQSFMVDYTVPSVIDNLKHVADR